MADGEPQARGARRGRDKEPPRLRRAQRHDGVQLMVAEGRGRRGLDYGDRHREDRPELWLIRQNRVDRLGVERAECPLRHRRGRNHQAEGARAIRKVHVIRRLDPRGAGAQAQVSGEGHPGLRRDGLGPRWGDLDGDPATRLGQDLAELQSPAAAGEGALVDLEVIKPAERRDALQGLQTFPRPRRVDQARATRGRILVG